MAHKTDDLKARLLATFQVEAEEHLQALTANLAALARELPPAESRAAVEVSFREMHTLKGAARSVGLTAVEALCQACEAIFSKLSRGEIPLSPLTLAALREAVERIPLLLAGAPGQAGAGGLLGRLKSIGATGHSVPTVSAEDTAAQAPAPAPASATAPPTVSTVRLDTAKLDALQLQAEELLLSKLATEERMQEAREVLELVARCGTAFARKRTARHATDFKSPSAVLSTDTGTAMKAVEARAMVLLEHVTRDHRMLTATVDGLQGNLRLLRMTPASAILNPFPAMVHSLADELGKQVEYSVQGAELEADRRVIEAIKDPLIHLVRNAVDHGIETPEVRTAASKTPRGRISVTVAPLEGNRIEIRVEDDGRGIDLAQVRAAAVRARQLTSEEAQELTDEEALDLIYRSGISTTPLISDVSGHGLGLAIVRERVERLDGRIRVESRPGTGTTVRMTLPVAIATFRGLLVRADGQPFLLPSEAIERAIHLPSPDLHNREGQPMIQWEGRPLLLARLADLLGLPTKKDVPGSNGRPPCIVLRVRDVRVALIVDEVQGEQEVVVKELQPPLLRVRNVAAAGLLGTGQVVLVLRPSDLLGTIRERPRPPAASVAVREERRQPAILVVDDSITTRTMEKNLLEGAGYQVHVAVDGMEAWAVLRSMPIDLVVSDVDMPRMNGLELTEKVRADRDLANLPVILVTALETREDKERGLEVGANAYIVKSSFDQSNLLEFIRRHL